MKASNAASAISAVRAVAPPPAASSIPSQQLLEVLASKLDHQRLSVVAATVARQAIAVASTGLLAAAAIAGGCPIFLLVAEKQLNAQRRTVLVAAGESQQKIPSPIFETVLSHERDPPQEFARRVLSDFIGGPPETLGRREVKKKLRSTLVRLASQAGVTLSTIALLDAIASIHVLSKAFSTAVAAALGLPSTRLRSFASLLDVATSLPLLIFQRCVFPRALGNAVANSTVIRALSAVPLALDTVALQHALLVIAEPCDLAALHATMMAPWLFHSALVVALRPSQKSFFRVLAAASRTALCVGVAYAAACGAARWRGGTKGGVWAWYCLAALCTSLATSSKHRDHNSQDR